MNGYDEGVNGYVMNVLFQIPGSQSGAQASYAMLLKALAAAYPQDRYIIICNKDSLFWPMQSLPNIHVVAFRNGWLKELHRFWLNTIGIRRLVKKNQVHIVWSSNLGPYFRTGIPQVLAVFNPYQVCPWSQVRTHPRSRFVVAFLRMFFRRSLRYCDAVQVETADFGKIVCRIPGAPSRIDVIPKAIESGEDFTLLPLSDAMQSMFDGGLGRSAFTFLYVAVPSPHKNHAVLLKALSILDARGLPIRLAVSATAVQLGKVSDPELVNELVSQGRLLPLGWIDKNRLRAVYDACDACVMPSKSEQLSSAHLEAMHWRKPQISSDMPFAHELCGDATLYVDPDDPNAWADAMQKIAHDSTLRDRLIASGLARMKSYPQSWQEVAHRMRNCLVEIVEEYHARGNGQRTGN